MHAPLCSAAPCAGPAGHRRASPAPRAGRARRTQLPRSTGAGSHASAGVRSQRARGPSEVFTCSEESSFYSACLLDTLTRPEFCQGARAPATAVEFGCGDGGPVIDALLRAGPHFASHVHGFELNRAAGQLAQGRCRELGLGASYTVHTQCFYEGIGGLPSAARPAWLLANPPYLPAHSPQDLIMPELCGGPSGAELTNSLLDLDIPNALLLVSSISNPLSTIKHARALGYSVAHFTTTLLPFGHYSRQEEVQRRIRDMRAEGKAFFIPGSSAAHDGNGSSDHAGNGAYLLAGVTFQRSNSSHNGNGAGGVACRGDALARVMAALQ